MTYRHERRIVSSRFESTKQSNRNFKQNPACWRKSSLTKTITTGQSLIIIGSAGRKVSAPTKTKTLKKEAIMADKKLHDILTVIGIFLTVWLMMFL